MSTTVDNMNVTTINNGNSSALPSASRRRMHSWSRLRRSPEEKARLRAVLSSKSFDDTEQEITDQTQIAFAQDGAWFQGNINPPHHCVIQIQGRRIEAVSETPTSCASSSTSSSDDASMTSSFASRSRKSSSGSVCESSSISSSIDSDAVQEALQKLSEEEEDSSPRPELYRVTVSDMETGLSYLLEEVSVVRTEDSCYVYSEQLDFKSEAILRGVSANTILVSQFGPSFANQDLHLFDGKVSFRYTDKVYRPAHATERMMQAGAGKSEWL